MPMSKCKAGLSGTAVERDYHHGMDLLEPSGFLLPGHKIGYDHIKSPPIFNKGVCVKAGSAYDFLFATILVV